MIRHFAIDVIRIGCRGLVLLLMLSALTAGAVEIVDGQYVTVRDGHLSYNGRPLRLWGMNLCGSIKRGLDDLPMDFDRMAFMNFNAIRTNFTEGMTLPRNAADSVHLIPAVKGDDSQLDRLDYSIYLGRERGMIFWLEFDQYSQFRPADYALAGDIDDGLSQPEWNELIQQGLSSAVAYVSERGEAILHQYAANLLNHVNPYTGKRYAEEEAIGLYQIFNENSFASTLVAQPFDGVMGRCIEKRWNEFLKRRYHTEAGLRAAWGALADGESLDAGTVKFGPLPQATREERAGYQFVYTAASEKTDEITRRRREDIMRFAYDLYTGFNRRFTDYLRSLAPEGIGVNVVPITSTCRYADDVMMYAAADLVSDFTALGSYSFATRPWEVAKDDPFYPYILRVNGAPLIENPIDLFKVAGKPYLIYEVNDYRPNPYRVEFPVRVAVNSLLRGGDGVFWFNWDDNGFIPNMHSDLDYINRPMPMPNTCYPNAALLLCTDEVMLSAIKAAGELFLYSGAEAFANPRKLVIGKDILLDMEQRSITPKLMSALYPAAWTEGVELEYSMTENSRLLPPAAYQGNAVEYDNGIRLDWGNRRGYYRVDRPNAKVFAGFVPEEIRLGDVVFRNLNRDYLLAALIALDGKPLRDSAKVTLTLACRSENTGFKMDLDRFVKPWADGIAEAVIDGGRLPVIVERVATEITAPELIGKTIRKYDFARRCYATEVIHNTIRVTADEPLFFAEITNE